jgi:hypothetical protein
MYLWPFFLCSLVRLEMGSLLFYSIFLVLNSLCMFYSVYLLSSSFRFYSTTGMELPLSSKGRFTQKSHSRSTSSLNEGTLSSFGSLASCPLKKSSLVSADEDFHYINKSNLGDYINQNVPFEQSFGKKPSKLAQLLGRLNFDAKPTYETTGQSRWFKFRPKHKLSASISNVFSKIVEENGESQVTPVRSVCMSSKKSLPRSRSRSEHDLCSETISRICPATGICTIDRGSQTDLEPKKLSRTW